MRVDLGKDRWAEVIDIDDVPHRIKHKVQEWGLAEFKRDVMHQAMIAMIIRDMLISRLITSWSFEAPIPNGDPQHLGDLPSSAYDALVTATEPHYLDLDFIKEVRARTTARSSDSAPTSEESPPQDTNPIPIT